jgi:hypothetical protein
MKQQHLGIVTSRLIYHRETDSSSNEQPDKNGWMDEIDK